MADPTFDFANWAKAAAPYLMMSNPLTAPLATTNAVLGAFGGAKAQPSAVAAPVQGASIGTEKDFGRLIGTKVYTGPKFGYQTLDTALTLNPAAVSADPTDQAEFRRVQQVLKANFASSKNPPVVQPPAPAPDRRAEETGTKTGIPGQKGAPQTTDPETAVYQKYLEKILFDPEFRARVTKEDTENFLRRSLLTNALSMRQSRENTQRQVELKNIEAWKELERARIDANTRQAIALQSTIAASMLPNQGLMAGMTAAYQAAMAPLSSIS